MAEKKVICVIDDDPDIIETVQTILSAKGYEVVSASSGRDGLELLQTSRPDLILCDMMMETMDSGMQTVQQYRKDHGGSIPVFLLSSIGEMTAATAQIQELGFNGIIQKPVDPARLLATIQNVIA